MGAGAGGGRRVSTALVVEPDETRAHDLVAHLATAGLTARAVGDAEAGWRAFAAEPPGIIFTALSTPRRDAAWLLRRMREDWLGTLPAVYGLAADESEIGPHTRDLELDGLLFWPLTASAVVHLATDAGAGHDDHARQAVRLRDLFDLSLLGDDMDAALATFVDRVALNFRATDCVLWGPPHEKRWPKTRLGARRPEDQARLLWRCDLALSAGATIITSDGSAGAAAAAATGSSEALYSVLAVPVDAPGARGLGALCLVDHTARRFSSEERDALVLVARRLARELAWRSAHDRLVADHDHLRETAQRDPLTAALTPGALAGALEQAAAAATAQHPASVVVFDVTDLRTINDRYGHAVGDATLQHVTRVIEGELRREDALGRIAGDELAVVLPGMALGGAHAFADRTRKKVAESSLRHHGLEVPVRVRAGVTSVEPGETGDLVLARADAALRSAQRSHAHVVAVAPGEELRNDPTGVNEANLADLESPSDVLPAGTTLGGMYQILHEISRGAMGVVYRAEDLGLGRPVAVKVLRADLAKDADLVGRFREEAATLANLRHEHLVQVYAFGAREHDVYFVMELVEGEQLADIMQRADESGEPMNLALVAQIVSQVAGALGAMHQAGVVHRDVKPANVLLDRVRDRAVLVDVGVAKRRGVGGDAAGTPGFAAPESFTQGDEGPATDVYGLACVAYMMLTGLAPFGGGDINKVIRRQLQDRPATPSKLRPELASAVDRVLARALSPKPADRYPGAIEFAAALGHALTLPPDEPGAPLASGTDRHAAVGGDGTPLQQSAAEVLGSGTRRLAQPVATSQDLGESRGALFRVAYRILGNRLGSAWVRRACEDHPDLVEVLRPTVAPYEWYPTDRLVALLHAVPAQVRDPKKVARELGRAAMTATFARFLGADPSGLSPDAALGAATEYWNRYHSWGDVEVEAQAGHMLVRLTRTPREQLLCMWVEGSLERIAEMAGGSQVSARHVACEAQGAQACAYEVRWS